jgi:hypothetical protein
MSSITSLGTLGSAMGSGAGAGSMLGVGMAVACFVPKAGFVGNTVYPMAKHPPTMINNPVP